MSRIGNEPTFVDGKINPFFQPSEDYVPFVQTLKWVVEKKGKCDHFYELHDSYDPNGTPVMCVYCQIGRTLGPDATLRDGKIVPK